LRTLQVNSSQDPSIDVHQVDPTTKLQAWKEATEGKSRGRVYGTTDLAGNFRQGFSSLTQFTSASHSGPGASQSN